MATAAPKLAPFEFPLDSDAGTAKPTLFRVRPLSGIEYLHSGEIMSMRSRAESFEFVLQTALLGWSHFTAPEGGEIEFARTQSENLARLTVGQISELVNRIFAASALGEDERKN
ncbi:MAG: hypothetical protein A2V92_03715 [Candidatus Muproteobacteria bacterium RBG_16_65_31]|uniref:Uncharacterized protein n=1 Tax=Candidatus Muproteobacteria bacterium RBG_16_65_31 TaxID=1817759 RepID=A0A1F6THD5_9PROT|nr:MAG: hypothetical protein A2V92_03715 [Candidatus Muproteobacteria bacterium RBG_16_65_31]